MRIGLLTGTFDPVHYGHLALARTAMSVCDLAAVWFLVNPRPAHKSEVTPVVHRLAMVDLVLRDEPKLILPEPSEQPAHTMAGLGQFMETWPDSEFIFIAGLDVMAGLDRWDDYERVVRQAEFAVAHRPGASLETLEALRGRLGGLGGQLQARSFEFDTHAAASSTAIREAVRLGRPSSALDERVYDYIRRHRLYG